MFVKNYQEAVDYLYVQYPLFQNVGSKAYKPGIGNIVQLCLHFNNPHQKLRFVHVAGTNGKGSSSNMLAAIFQAAGYKTGLFTSPHLKKFTERIRVNGTELEETYLLDFINSNAGYFEELRPSFFELTTILAFNYFLEKDVDIVILETGLGGRLDSTNIVKPEISLITNIGWDHVDLLGDSLPKIAAEKAGIIKENTPVVISEFQDEVAEVFIQKAQNESAPLFFAEKEYQITNSEYKNGLLEVHIVENQNIALKYKLQLSGFYQTKNLKGVLKTIALLQKKSWEIGEEAIKIGLENVSNLTNFKGRWQKIKNAPLTICDTGHNVNGISAVFEQINSIPHQQLWCIMGMAKDKSIEHVMSLLPIQAKYIFCQANISRAANAEFLMEEAQKFGLNAMVIKNVNEALAYVWKMANEEDLVFVGGSTFVVGEVDGI